MKFPVRPLLVAFLASLAVSVASARIVREVQETFDVEPGQLISMTIQGGDIEVMTHDRDQVEVHAKLVFPRADSAAEADEIMALLDFQISHDDEGVQVTAERVKGTTSGWFSRGSNRAFVDLTVRVPTQFNVEARTSGGDIEVSDLIGHVHGRTSGGDIAVGHVEGPVDISTSGGDVSVEHAVGTVRATTSGGDIRVAAARGSVSASTSGGDVDIGRVEGLLKASTSGGDISARIYGPLQDDAVLSTSGGDVTAWVEEGIGFDLNARTSGGNVRAPGITIKIDDGGMGKNKLVGQVNGGGHELKLRTSGGNVRVKTS